MKRLVHAMSRVLLVRPNDFIADAMEALVTRLGHEVSRIRTPSDLAEMDFAGVVGAVVSTAVTSSVPMSFSEAVASVRRRSQVPLVATTMLRDEKKALDFVRSELGANRGLVPFTTTSPPPRPVGTSSGLLVLRKEEVDAPTPSTLELLARHFHPALDRPRGA